LARGPGSRVRSVGEEPVWIPPEAGLLESKTWEEKYARSFKNKDLL
jgi:hypothetical protein